MEAHGFYRANLRSLAAACRGAESDTSIELQVIVAAKKKNDSFDAIKIWPVGAYLPRSNVMLQSEITI